MRREHGEGVRTDPERDAGLLERRLPHVETKPVTRNVAVCVHRPQAARLISLGCAALRAIYGERVSAGAAAALSGVVTAERAVPVAALSGVWFGQAEGCRVGKHAQPARWHLLRGHGEQQVLVAKATVVNMCTQLGDELLAQLEAAVLLVLWIGLYEKPLAIGVEFRIHLHHRPAHRQDPAPVIEVFDPQLSELPPPQPALDVCLDKQPRIRVRKCLVDRVELLRSDDLKRLA
jgi:hypothetical protein